MLGLTAVFAIYWLLASQLMKQKENELYIAGTAVSQIIETYINSSGALLQRIADSEALEKYHVSYNALALRAYLEPLLQRFDGIVITDNHGKNIVLGRGVPLARMDSFEPNANIRQDPNVTQVSTLVDSDGTVYLLFSYDYVNYFDEPVASIRATASAERILPAIVDFIAAAKVRVSVLDSAGQIVIDENFAGAARLDGRRGSHDPAAGGVRAAGFYNDVAFLGCDCVANVLSVANRDLTVFTVISREEYKKPLVRLRWIVVASAMILLLASLAVMGLLHESNYQVSENRLVESKMRFKNEFMAKMSHELRTPLNAIIGYSELVHEEMEERSPADLRADVEKITLSAKHLLHLINQILDIQKIEAGKMKIVLEAFSIDGLLQDTVDTMLPLAKRSRQDLVVRVPGTTQPIFSDMTKVRQILLNFLSNALKFSGEETRIEVELEIVREADQTWYWIHITDQGPGIDDKDVEKLFQEFSQLDTTSRQNNLGTGLGLAINKRLCELLGGQISIKSGKGKGTRVTVKLPAEWVQKKADNEP